MRDFFTTATYGADTARYSTVDAAFRECLRLLAYVSTPRTLSHSQSHRLNGTLTRLKIQRGAQKIFRMRWEKSVVGRFASRLMFAEIRVRHAPCSHRKATLMKAL